MFTLKNESNGKIAKINEIVFLDCMKLAKIRNKKLYDILVDVWEQIYNEKFKEEMLDY